MNHLKYGQQLLGLTLESKSLIMKLGPDIRHSGDTANVTLKCSHCMMGTNIIKLKHCARCLHSSETPLVCIGGKASVLRYKCSY